MNKSEENRVVEPNFSKYLIQREKKSSKLSSQKLLVIVWIKKSGKFRMLTNLLVKIMLTETTKLNVRATVGANNS